MPLNSLTNCSPFQDEHAYDAGVPDFMPMQSAALPYNYTQYAMYSHSPPSFPDMTLPYTPSKPAELYYNMPYSNVSVDSTLAYPPILASPYMSADINPSMYYHAYMQPPYVHEATKQFQCSFQGCGKLFKRTEHLKRHLNTVHTDFKPFVCGHPQCLKRFSRSDNLSQHLRTHRPKPNKPLV